MLVFLFSFIILLNYIILSFPFLSSSSLFVHYYDAGTSSAVLFRNVTGAQLHVMTVLHFLHLFYLYFIFLFFYYWLLLMMNGARSLIHVLILVITFYFIFKAQTKFRFKFTFPTLQTVHVTVIVTFLFNLSLFVSYYHLSSPLSGYCPPRKACIL